MSARTDLPKGYSQCQFDRAYRELELRFELDLMEKSAAATRASAEASWAVHRMHGLPALTAEQVFEAAKLWRK